MTTEQLPETEQLDQMLGSVSLRCSLVESIQCQTQNQYEYEYDAFEKSINESAKSN